MKRAIAAALLIGVLAGAAPASPATPTDRKVAALQKQVRTLQRQVRTLQRQVRTADNRAAAGIVLSFCIAAITADALQSTWTVVNQVAARTAIPASPSVNDRGRCQTVEVSRQQGVVPPSISPFSALFALLSGSMLSPAWSR